MSKLAKKNKIAALIILIMISAFYGLSKNVEILRVPAFHVTVIYKKWPLFSPRIELRRFNGKLLDSKIVDKRVTIKYIEVHVTEDALVVFPGYCDWVWPCTLWEKRE